MAPVECESWQLDESQEVTRRRRVDNDSLVTSLFECLAKRGEGIEFVDPRWRECEQIAQDRPIVREIDAAGHERVEEAVDAIAISVAQLAKRGCRFDLPDMKARCVDRFGTG